MPDSRAARALGCTDGQVWTLGVILGLAAALLAATLPSGLHPRGDTVLLPARQPLRTSGSPVVAPTPLPAPVLVPVPLAPVALLPLAPVPTAPPAHQAESPAARGPAPAPAPGSPPAGPLVVTRAGWYADDPERTARQRLTPPDELPVTAVRGSRSATSSLRLRGAGPQLVLTVDPAAGRTTGTPQVELCRNATAGWLAADAQPAPAAPPVRTPCVRGTESGQTWTFALDRLGSADADPGFTLRAVVSASPTETFAVTFYREPPR